MSKDKHTFNKQKPNQKRQTKPVRARREESAPDEIMEDDEQQQDLVAGRLPAIEVLKSERDINKVFIQEGLSGSKMNEIQQLSKKRNI